MQMDVCTRPRNSEGFSPVIFGPGEPQLVKSPGLSPAEVSAVTPCVGSNPRVGDQHGMGQIGRTGIFLFRTELYQKVSVFQKRHNFS